MEASVLLSIHRSGPAGPAGGRDRYRIVPEAHPVTQAQYAGVPMGEPTWADGILDLERIKSTQSTGQP